MRKQRFIFNAIILFLSIFMMGITVLAKEQTSDSDKSVIFLFDSRLN